MSRRAPTPVRGDGEKQTFIWTQTADEMLAKVAKFGRTSNPGHYGAVCVFRRRRMRTTPSSAKVS